MLEDTRLRGNVLAEKPRIGLLEEKVNCAVGKTALIDTTHGINKKKRGDVESLG
jgi:hypothetical protein